MEGGMSPTVHNITVLVTEVDEVAVIPGTGARNRDEEYEQFLADVWVGVVLTLMVLSCVCCVCSCLLYHKFQQWKRSVLEARAQNVESGGTADVESLPSYTIVSGLPTYDEALEQLRKVHELRTETDVKMAEAQSTPNNVSMCETNQRSHQPPQPLAKLSVTEFLENYKTYPQ